MQFYFSISLGRYNTFYCFRENRTVQEPLRNILIIHRARYTSIIITSYYIYIYIYIYYINK